jgi:hypothetical protein
LGGDQVARGEAECVDRPEAEDAGGEEGEQAAVVDAGEDEAGEDEEGGDGELGEKQQLVGIDAGADVDGEDA